MENIPILIKFQSLTSMIMHSSQTADPTNRFTKELKKISGKRSKTDEDHEAMSRIEYEASLYRDTAEFKTPTSLYMPTENIMACLVNAGKKLKHGRGSMKTAVTGILMDNPLGYALDVPWNSYEEMYEDSRTWFKKIVTVQSSKILRTRVLIPSWSFEVQAELEPDICTIEMLNSMLEVAGKLIGLGDWRPSSGTPGSYGKFLAQAEKV